ncbi:MAG: alpha/beta hydrolase [Ramlibacter sp.]|nr:alpha/beta hydrolase [Ramlibacter sp.]
MGFGAGLRRMGRMDRSTPARHTERGAVDVDGGWGAPSAGPGPIALIVPGWRGSGHGHWQSLWAQQLPGARRVEQEDWHHPTRAAWVGGIERGVLAAGGPVVLVAHSLGCIAAVHLAPEVACRVHAALLVAPADPERRATFQDFAPVPSQPLPYRSIVVASGNDRHCPPRLASAYARAWGSEFFRLPEAGHINVESGHGDWPLGLALLQSLMGVQAASPLPIAI